MRVELIYERDGAPVARARWNLWAAMCRVGQRRAWTETQQRSSTQKHVKGPATPLILVDGREVVDAVSDAVQVPSVSRIEKALRAASA